MDKKTVIIILLLLVGVVGTIILFSKNYNFKLYVLNAGKADSSVIYYKDKTIVIDTGEEDFYNTLNNHLKSHNSSKIDYLIITHFDKDHVGSASKLIDDYEIGTIYITNTIKESDYYKNYVASINKKNITPKIVTGDLDVSIDDLKIVINGPDKLYAYDESNNSSLIVSIKYKQHSFLFMGDALNERMKDYIETHDGSYDVIKLPHHGDYLKQDEELIKKYNPRTVIVSSNFIDEKLKSLISKYNLTMHYTNEANAYLYKEL